jgi:hypothetical protein
VQDGDARTTADRLREAVADALRRVGPPESDLEPLPMTAGNADDHFAKGP